MGLKEASPSDDNPYVHRHRCAKGFGENMSDSGISVGGLASGLDTNSIITGLISIEQGRVTKEQKKQQDYEVKLSTFNDLKSKLDDFYNKAKDMDKATALDVFRSSSSDDSIATITGESGATSGNYDVTVDQLASTLKIASKSFASATVAPGVAGQFKISVSAAALANTPTTTDVTIDVTATDSLKEIAAKINRTAGSGAKASVVQVGSGDFRLMLTAVDEGTKGFNLTATDGTGILMGAGLDLVAASSNPAIAKQAIKTDFDFRLAAGGPAATTSLMSNLWAGVGAGKALTATDVISWTATDPAGNDCSGTFNVAGGSTMQDLLNQLNTTFDTAAGSDSVDVSLNSSGEIIVTDKTGAPAGNFTLSGWGLTDTDGSGSTMAFGTSTTAPSYKNVISQGKKAFYTLNGLSVSSQTNTDKTTITGTVFQLKKADTTEVVKLQLDFDKDGVKKKVQEFLDGYNQLVKFIDDKSKVEVKKVDSEGNPTTGVSNRTSIIKGPFAGDSTILALKTQLQSLLTNKIDELGTQTVGAGTQRLSMYSSLASIGIVSESKTGFLTINNDQFNNALDSDFEGVKRLFKTDGYATNGTHTFGTYSKDTKTGIYRIDADLKTIDTVKSAATSTMVAATISGDNDILNSDSGDSKGLAVQATSGTGYVTFVRGVAGQIKSYYDRVNSYSDGSITNTSKSIQKRIDDEKSRITVLEKHVSEIKTRLTKQFANLELSISKLQQQSASFGGQISSMRR
jgi:flagellar hook-associated protein 2